MHPSWPGRPSPWVSMPHIIESTVQISYGVKFIMIMTYSCHVVEAHTSYRAPSIRSVLVIQNWARYRRLRWSSDGTCNKTVNHQATPSDLEIQRKLGAHDLQVLGTSLCKCGNQILEVAMSIASLLCVLIARPRSLNFNMRGSTPGKLLRHYRDRASAMSKETSIVQ